MLIDFVGLFEFGLKDFAHDDLIAQSALARSQDASWSRSGSRRSWLGHRLLTLVRLLIGDANALIVRGKRVYGLGNFKVLKFRKLKHLILFLALLGSLGCVGYQAYHNNNYC